MLDKIWEVIKSFKNSCTAGDIVIKMLKLCKELFAITICNHISIYIHTGCNLDCLMISKIVPIFKSDSRCIINLSKIFEMILKNRLGYFIKTQKKYLKLVNLDFVGVICYSIGSRNSSLHE